MAVNKSYPYETKEKVRVTSELDELMYKYYRYNEDGRLHVEAYETGQALQWYFAVYSAGLLNQTLTKKKLRMPTTQDLMDGLEAPITLMLNNAFYRAHFPELSAAILMETAKMNTARASDDINVAHALQVSKWEFLSLIAALVSGTNAQKAMDFEMRKFTATELETSINIIKEMNEREKAEFEKHEE